MNGLALITGASSGFGKAIAEKFASRGYDIIITGRRKNKLEELSSSIKQKFPVKILVLDFDVQDKKAVDQHLANLPEEWRQIDVLVNNAGLALGKDYFEEANMDDWETMIDTNVKGLMYVTRAILPFMIARKKGHIINMGSVAAKEVYERGNGYSASKFAVDALSKAMRIDLLRHNIRVTAIHPGAAETAFSLVRFKGNEQEAQKVYEGFTPLSAEDVAETTWFCASLPPHVCINDLVITPTAQANSFYLNKK